MKNIYAFRNTLISAYNDPIFREQEKDSFAKEVQRFCILEKDAATKNHYHECELYLLGTFNDESGEMKLLDKPEFLIGLSQFFKE